MKIEFEIREDDYKKLSKIIESRNFSIDDYLKQLLIDDLNYIAYLENDYIFDTRKKVLLYKNELIPLNNLETQIIDFLISKPNEIVPVEDIISNCIKTKEMSIFSFRNKIKGIRAKTYKNFIMMKSNHGYWINLLV